jgi:hypothetical protein
MFERYVYSFNKNNLLDRLEDFWISKDFTLPTFCNSGKHYLGMSNNCNYCINYRNNGLY